MILLVLDLSGQTPQPPTGTPRHAILGIFHGLRPKRGHRKTGQVGFDHGKLMGKIDEKYGI